MRVDGWCDLQPWIDCGLNAGGVTLLRPASERPPRVGDVYEYVHDKTRRELRSEDGVYFDVHGYSHGIERVSHMAVHRYVASGNWRLKTPGKGSVDVDRAEPISPPTEPAPAFEVGGVLEYAYGTGNKFTLERTDGEWNYWQPFGKDRVEDNIEAIAEGRATYTPPGVGPVETFECCSLCGIRDVDAGWNPRCSNAFQRAETLTDFLVALHAPPAVCADCGKGPAIAMGTSEERIHLCVYCERRHFPRTMRESLPSAVAALPDKPGPYEGACAWESPSWGEL